MMAQRWRLPCRYGAWSPGPGPARAARNRGRRRRAAAAGPSEAQPGLEPAQAGGPGKLETSIIMITVIARQRPGPARAAAASECCPDILAVKLPVQLEGCGRSDGWPPPPAGLAAGGGR
jgi:hypothetical protein